MLTSRSWRLAVEALSDQRRSVGRFSGRGVRNGAGDGGTANPSLRLGFGVRDIRKR